MRDVVPGYERAELTAELKIAPSKEGNLESLEAAKRAAGESGLAREASPWSIMLAGGHREVIEATRVVMEAALEAGAKTIEVRVEMEENSDRF